MDTYAKLDTILKTCSVCRFYADLFWEFHEKLDEGDASAWEGYGAVLKGMLNEKLEPETEKLMNGICDYCEEFPGVYFVNGDMRDRYEWWKSVNEKANEIEHKYDRMNYILDQFEALEEMEMNTICDN